MRKLKNKRKSKSIHARENVLGADLLKRRTIIDEATMASRHVKIETKESHLQNVGMSAEDIKKTEKMRLREKVKKEMLKN